MGTQFGLPSGAPGAAQGSGLTSGTIVAEKYRVLSELGSGAMGAVFLAEHVTLGRRVALKTIHKELLGSAEAVARFEREALAGARIDHPGVVAATDVVRLADGSPVLVLEYVQGRSVTRLLAEDGAPALRVTLHLLESLASALCAAHAAGVVHRDLKPDNLLIVEREGVPNTLKILDFGIAKLMGEAAQSLAPLAPLASQSPGTQLGMVYGTPRYMAPEQALGQAVDARVDLYAVGVIAYELLTGRVPFNGPDLMTIVTKQLTEVPAPLPPAVPAALASLVERLLVPQADQRISSANELVDILRGVCLDGPLTTPPGPHERLAPSASQRGVSAGEPAQRSAIRRSVWTAGALALVPGALALFLNQRRHLPGLSGSVGAAHALVAQVSPVDRAAPEELLRCKNAGRSALEALAYRFPQDPSVIAALVEVAHAEGSPLLVAKQLAMLAEVNGAAAQNFAAMAAIDAQKSEEAASAIVPLLAKKLGTSGLDALMGLAERKGPARTQAIAWLRDPEVFQRLSPASRVFVEVRGAKTCAERKNFFRRMASDGDERLAPMISSWASERGCGFLNLQDCHPCLRTKDARAQLAELKARFSEKR